MERKGVQSSSLTINISCLRDFHVHKHIHRHTLGCSPVANTCVCPLQARGKSACTKVICLKASFRLPLREKILALVA